MEKDFTTKMKEILIEMKKEIVSQLMANSSDFRDIVEGMEAKDSVDIASDDIDRKMLEAMGADAVVNIHYASRAIMSSAAEVMAYGTAVKIK